MSDETKCPKCGADAGEVHKLGCDYEQSLRRQLAEREDTHKAEVERLHCIMLVLVGEAALALGDDHELVSRLRAIREQTIDEAAEAAKRGTP